MQKFLSEDTNWAKEENRYCEGYTKLGTFKDLHAAQMECLKREKCVKVLDRACKKSEFFLCLSDELENESETGWCMYQKPGTNIHHCLTSLNLYMFYVPFHIIFTYNISFS